MRLIFLIFLIFAYPSFAQTATEVQEIDFGKIGVPSYGGSLTIHPDGSVVGYSGEVSLYGFPGSIRYEGDPDIGMQNFINNTVSLVGPGEDILLSTIEFGSSTFTLDSSGVYEMMMGASITYNANQTPGVYIGTYSLTYSPLTNWNPQTFIGTVRVEVVSSSSGSPLILSEISSLSFGTLSLGQSDSSVEITPDGTLTVLSGDATITNSGYAASFDVAGLDDANVYVSFDSSINLTNGSSVIVLDQLIKDGGNSAPVILDSNGFASFSVGGTLTIPASISSGSYVGTYQVTVNY